MARRNVIANSGAFEIKGLKELERTLIEMGGVIATKVGRTADRKAAQAMLAVMKETAPYDPRTKKKSYVYKKKGKATGSRQTDYGHLRDELNVRLARARKETTITYTIGVGDAFWGFFQEFGTKNMAARPWMRPAFDASVPLAIKQQTDQLRAGIDREAKKIAKANGSVK